MYLWYFGASVPAGSYLDVWNSSSGSFPFFNFASLQTPVTGQIRKVGGYIIGGASVAESCEVYVDDVATGITLSWGIGDVYPVVTANFAVTADANAIGIKSVGGVTDGIRVYILIETT